MSRLGQEIPEDRFFKGTYIMRATLDGPVGGSVRGTDLHFDSDSSKVKVGYWYELLKMLGPQHLRWMKTVHLSEQCLQGYVCCWTKSCQHIKKLTDCMKGRN